MRKNKSIQSDSRRKFLMGSSMMLIPGSVSLAKAELAPLEVPEWSHEIGEDVGENQYGIPSDFESKVVREYSNYKTAGPDYNAPMDASSWTLTPLEKLRGTITPNGLFFVRAHGGIPDIDPANHRLVIHGLVKNSLMLNMDDLKRFPSTTRSYFIECSGNSDLVFENLGSTCADIHGLVSCAQWQGVKLSVLLEEAGIDLDKAKFILVEGADGVKMTRTLPIGRAMDDCLIVYGQNGEALRKEQGYPVRLVVPGCEGNLNVKWLRRMEISETPFYTKDETAKYTDLNSKTGKASISTLVMETKSLITFPSGGQELKDLGYYEIRGLAWSGRGKITRVDVSTDGGENWKTAKLTGPVLSKCLTEFKIDWNWDGTETIILSRSQDETGTVQPYFEQIIKDRSRSSAYHMNAIQSWRISSGGKVTNAKSKI